MKKILYLCLMVSLLFALAGCKIESDTGIIVSKNGDVTIERVTAYDNETIDQMIEQDKMSGDIDLSDNEEITMPEVVEHTDEERWEYLMAQEATSDTSFDESGEEVIDPLATYNKEKFESGDFKGFKYSKVIGKIKDFSNNSGDGVEITSFTEKDQIFSKEGDLYVLRAHLDSAESYTEETEAEGNIATFYIKLPQPAVSNNATTVSEDGLTYTWNLFKDQEVEISFKTSSISTGLFSGLTSTTSNGEPAPMNYVPVVVGAVVIVVAIIGIVVATKNKGE